MGRGQSDTFIMFPDDFQIHDGWIWPCFFLWKIIGVREVMVHNYITKLK